jgi:hypothetical protein
MPITIEELNGKYNAEDKNWEFKKFFSWLYRKGIPERLIPIVLKQVLLECSIYTLPEMHHDFDLYVLSLAIKSKDNADELATSSLETSLKEGFAVYEKEWNDLSKSKKIWEVLRGRA